MLQEALCSALHSGAVESCTATLYNALYNATLYKTQQHPQLWRQSVLEEGS